MVRSLAESSFRLLRESMLRRQISKRGVRDPRVLAAMQAVPRHEFVPGRYIVFSYADTPLPIGDSQTISQPFMVALMTQCLNLHPTDRVLEIGAGSGYQAAVLAQLVRHVWSIELRERLARKARERLLRLGYDNITVLAADGSLGLPEHAPYDAICVTAGAPETPGPLLNQLAEGGRLVIPVGTETAQSLKLIRKTNGRFSTRQGRPKSRRWRTHRRRRQRGARHLRTDRCDSHWFDHC